MTRENGLISKEDVKWQIQEWIAEFNEALDMLDSLPSEDRPTGSDFVSKAKVLETYSELYWFDSDCGVVSKAEVDKIYERLQSLPSEDRPKSMIHIDEVYRLIAGHSNYHGDSILSAFTCLVEGKDVKPIAPLDESAEPKTGKWVMLERDENVHDIHGVPTWGVNYMCDKCGFITTAIQDHFSQYKFCPNCGAKMEREK